jgi:hypothetical protein
VKLTVDRAVSAKQLDKEAVLPWANKEAIPLLRDLRDFANREITIAVDMTTTGTERPLLWSSDEMPTDAAWTVEATVLALAPTGSMTRGQRAGFYSVGGALSEMAPGYIVYQLGSAGFDMALSSTDRTITLYVSNYLAAATDVTQWRGLIRILPSVEIPA